jgi:hypothetical protein
MTGPISPVHSFSHHCLSVSRLILDDQIFFTSRIQSVTPNATKGKEFGVDRGSDFCYKRQTWNTHRGGISTPM